MKHDNEVSLSTKYLAKKYKGKEETSETLTPLP